MTTTKEPGIIVNEGLGGFLDPPTYPTHTKSVEFDLRRRRENRGYMSLSSAVESEWLDDAVRAFAKQILDDWVRPPIESPKIQDWIRQVLGYFKNCWKGEGSEPQCWQVSNLVTLEKDYLPGRIGLLDHAGVHLIRKFYPDFLPTEAHFTEAYWGTKPEKSNV
jgi:hypothetical protein